MGVPRVLPAVVCALLLAAVGGRGASAARPGAEEIAFSAGAPAKVYTLNLRTGAPHRVVRGLTAQMDPSWSPDGRRLAFAGVLQARPSQIYVVSVDGRDLRRLTRSGVADTNPVWSPDGTRIAFVEAPAVPTGYWGEARDLMVINADGTGLRRLTKDTGAKSDVSWSPDATRLMFIDGHILTRQVKILDLRSGRTINLATDAGSPVWSPDGADVAYVQSYPTRVELVIAAADGSRRRVLLSRPLARVPISVSWSPDGSAIAVSSGPPTSAPPS